MSTQTLVHRVVARPARPRPQSDLLTAARTTALADLLERAARSGADIPALLDAARREVAARLARTTESLRLDDQTKGQDR